MWICQHNWWFFFFLSKLSTNLWRTEVFTEIPLCLNIVAIYYLGSHGCHPSRHDVCCHLCCHGVGCHSCHSDGSCPGCGRVADDGRNLIHLCSADFCHCCSSGMTDADRGFYRVALSHLCQNFHLQVVASAEAWRSCHSTAAFGAATSCCSSWHSSADYQETKKTSAFEAEECTVENWTGWGSSGHGDLGYLQDLKSASSLDCCCDCYPIWTAHE